MWCYELDLWGKQHWSHRDDFPIAEQSLLVLWPFLPLTLPHQWAGWCYTGDWEGTELGQFTPTGPRDIPYHGAAWSAIKGEGKRRKTGCLAWWHLLFLLPVMKPWIPGDGRSTCLPTGHSAQILCLAVQLFLYPVNCLYLNPFFPHFYLSIFSHSGEWVTAWGWAASWGLPTTQCHYQSSPLSALLHLHLPGSKEQVKTCDTGLPSPG